MGGCCGAMKTGGKSLPEKKQQKADEKHKQNNKADLATAKAPAAESKPNDADAVKCNANGLEEKKSLKEVTAVPDVVINSDSKVEEELAAQIVSQAMAAAVAEASADAADQTAVPSAAAADGSAGGERKSEDEEAVEEWMKTDTNNELIISEQTLESKEHSEALAACIPTESVPLSETLAEAQLEDSVQQNLVESEAPIASDLIDHPDDVTVSEHVEESNLTPEVYEDIQTESNFSNDATLITPESSITAAVDLPEQTNEVESEVCGQSFISQTENSPVVDAGNSGPIVDQLSSQEPNEEQINEQITSQEYVSQPIHDEFTSETLAEPILTNSSNLESQATAEPHQEQHQDDQYLLQTPPSSALTESLPTSEQPPSAQDEPVTYPDLVANQNFEAPVLETVVELAKEQRDLWWAEGSAEETPVLETTVQAAKEQRDEWWTEGSSDQLTAPAQEESVEEKSSAVAAPVSETDAAELNHPTSAVSPLV